MGAQPPLPALPRPGTGPCPTAACPARSLCANATPNPAKKADPGYPWGHEELNAWSLQCMEQGTGSWP